MLDGGMRLDFRDGAVTLRAGEIYVVPRGVEHKPFAEHECQLMLIEPAGTINTGDSGGDMTAADGAWV